MDDDPVREARNLHDAMQVQRPEEAAFAGAFWSALPGTSQGQVLYDGETWTAHDAGLVRSHLKSETFGPRDYLRRTFTAEIILWHDVRDVEVSAELEQVGDNDLETWSILIQYPRLSVKGTWPNIKDFALAVARLASAHQ